MPSRCGFGVDAGLVATVGEGGVGDGGVEVLAHLVFVDHLAHRLADLARAGEGAAGDPVGDAGEQLVGRGQQVAAFAGTFGRERGVAAGDQPFPGVVGVADLGQVLGVEQAHLQRAVGAGEFGDRGRAQRGDPPEIGCGVGVVVEFAQRVDARGGDHAAIAHQHQPRDTELVADHGDDLGERDRVGGVAGEHPHRDRAAGRVGEHPVLDLLAALLAVAGVAARGQLATPAGHPRAGQVEQRHPAWIHVRGKVFGRELLLDRVLPLGEPVHRGVDLVGGRAGHAQIHPEGGVGPPGQRGQFRLRPHHPRDDQREHDVARPARRPQQRGQAQLARHRRDRGHVPVRQRPDDAELAAGRHQRLPLQRRLQCGDRLGGQPRQVGQRLVLHLAALAVGAPQQHRLVDALLARLRHIRTLVPGYMHPHWLRHN